MYHLIALQAAWLVVIKTDFEMIIDVHLGQWQDVDNLEDYAAPLLWPVIQLQAGDDVVFKNIAPDDQPYEMLAERYPEVFRLEIVQ